MSDSTGFTAAFQGRLSIYLCTTLIGLAAAWPVAAKPSFPKTAADVLIVDCLLPGQVRKLGRINSFLSPRRPARLSQFECGLRGGEYVEHDRANLQTSLSVWMASASSGNLEAMVMVGEAFAKGLGQEPDFAQAAFWFQRASDSGSKRAQQNLGHLYELGLGVPADREKALNFYRMASGVAGERVVFTSTLETETMLLARLDVANQDLTVERGLRAQAEAHVKRLQSQLKASQQDAAAKRAEVTRLKKAAASAPKPEDVQAMWRVLEEQIHVKEAEIALQSSELGKLELALLSDPAAPSDRNAGLAGARLGSVKLTIVQPALVATRGLPSVLAKSRAPITLIGRIDPRAGLTKLWVGAEIVAVEPDGLFRAQLPVSDVSRVQITALDSSGARNAFDFNVLGPSAALASSVNSSAPSAIVSSAPRRWPAGLKTGKRWLLAIGNQDYQSYPDLQASVNDAQALADVLSKNYGYSARVLRDATKNDVLLALDDIRRSAGAGDDVIVYFAGHGELSSGRGAWVPSEGVLNQPSTWIDNKIVSDMLAETPARNVLVLADSCYSGTLTASAVPRASPSFAASEWRAWAKVTGAGRSRMALTSGGVRPVFDAKSGRGSLFSQALLTVLSRNSGVLEAQTLYAQTSDVLALTVAASELTDLPTFAPIAFAGHERGELLLAGK